MKIKILSDQPVSKNLAEGDNTVTCAYPQSITLNNGGIACLYRQGRTKHSYDGILMLQTSSDYGKSWSEPSVVFDGRNLQPPRSAGSGGICQTSTGELLTTFWIIDASKPDVYVFSKEGKTFKRQICISHSRDFGKTWSKPSAIDTLPFPRAGITTKPFTLKNGELFVPIEIKTSLGPQGTAATFSSDNGQTFQPLIECAVDPEGNLNFCDAHFTALQNGDLLMLLWTFLQEGEKTIDVHQSISSDNGRTWSTPIGTGIQGQLASPLALPSGIVIAASNYRQPPEGIRLWLSKDSASTWECDSPVQMWDASKSCTLGETISNEVTESHNKDVWDALAKFTFGTPDLVDLGDGSILLTYYATINNITHVRACRFILLDV